MSRWIQGASVYQAIGIGCFWAVVFGNQAMYVALFPVYVAAALVIYNLDRLKADPADRINVPPEYRDDPGLNRLRGIVVALSLLVLLVWLPMFGHLWDEGIVVIGGLACVAYSLPIPFWGRRIKDLPLIKSLYPPLAITVAFIALPIALGAEGSVAVSPLIERMRTDSGELALHAATTFGFLVANVTLCDIRDEAGDRATGVSTLATMLGRRGASALVIAILIGVTSMHLLQRWFGDTQTAPGVQYVVADYLLIVAWIQWRRECLPRWFYSWVVDGFLYLPLVTILIDRLLAQR